MSSVRKLGPPDSSEISPTLRMVAALNLDAERNRTLPSEISRNPVSSDSSIGTFGSSPSNERKSM
jgi:hypothetical protein